MSYQLCIYLLHLIFNTLEIFIASYRDPRTQNAHFFGQILQRLVDRKCFRYTSSQNYLRQKSCLNVSLLGFSNRIYNLCMMRVLCVIHTCYCYGSISYVVKLVNITWFILDLMTELILYRSQQKYLAQHANLLYSCFRENSSCRMCNNQKLTGCWHKSILI